MFVIVPDKVFLKRVKKWIVEKDFVIADATDDYDSDLSDLGNRTQVAELTPTPVLRKIAADPDSAEAKIKRRNIKHYIENWLEDDAVGMRMLYFADMMCMNYERTGEDINVFIVMKKKDYQEYAGFLKERIDRYFDGFEMVMLVGKKTEKDDVTKWLRIQRGREFWGRLRKFLEKRRKEFDKSALAQVYHAL